MGQITKVKYAGATWWDILKAIFWRIVGCEHEIRDLGDEDGRWYYCFKCMKSYNDIV